MNRDDTQLLAHGVANLSTRQIAAVERRVHAFLGLLLAVAVAIGGAFALLHFATPCEGASLCLAAITPTVRSPWARLVDLYSRWRLRAHIRSAQQDLAWQHEQMQLAQWELEHLPRAMAVTRGHIDALEAQLRNLTGNRGL